MTFPKISLRIAAILLVAYATCSETRLARADFLISVQVDSNTIMNYQVASSSPVGVISQTFTSGGLTFEIELEGFESPTISGQQYFTGRITNSDTVAHTIQIMTSIQDFMTPTSPPPLLITDTTSGSATAGTMVTNGVFMGSADSGNALLGLSSSSQVGDFFGPGLSLTFNTSSSQSWSPTGQLYGFVPNGNPYSLSTYVSFVISPRISATTPSRVSFTGGNVNALSTVPVPSSLALLLTALPGGLGACWCFRRKQQRSTAG